MADPIPKVLLLHADTPTSRLVRESLEAFCECTVEVTSAALTAYEKALQKDYQLFLFDLHQSVLDGPMLYELLAKAYQFAQHGRALPAVIYFCDGAVTNMRDELLRDARVKALLSTPVNIQRLLERVGTILPLKTDPFHP
jgi:CheY-like chemotaxis protein